MAATGKIDPSTLSWVKSEIDETLKRARVALESFIENPTDETRLRFCITYLHQVVGTLQMVELDGASLLAHEAEIFAEAVFAKSVSATPEAFDLLTRSILSLPEYLARLQFGQADVPLRLAAIINDLRRMRGAPAPAEFDLFAPDLDVFPPTPQPAPTAADFQASIRQHRAAFQATLVAWLRDTAQHAPLQALADIIDQWRASAPAPVLRQFLWVASGFVEALAGALEPSTERKKLVGRIEQMAKKLLDDPDRSATRGQCESLTRLMLFELGSAREAGERASEIRSAFALDALFGVAMDDESPVESLPPPDILQSVSAALGKELEGVQDLFSAYIDPEHKETKSLASARELLAKIGRTLEMLGLNSLKSLVDEVHHTFTAIEEQGLALSDALSMRIASALLQLENTVRDFQGMGDARSLLEEHVSALRVLRGEVVAPGIDGIEISDAVLTDGEFRQLLGAVNDEIRSNLAKVEEAFEAFAAHTSDPKAIEAVPVHLTQVQGALQMLGQDRAAELAAVINQYLQDIIAGSVHPDAAICEALAVAIGTIGAYLDGLERGAGNLQRLVDLALGDLDTALSNQSVGGTVPLSVLKRALARDPFGQVEAEQMRGQLAQILGQYRGDDPRVTELADEIDQLLVFVAADPAPIKVEVRRALTQATETLLGLLQGQQRSAQGAGFVPAAAHDSTGAESVLVDPGMDPEILEIFVEDAREVSGSITRSLAAWEQDPESQEALAELRRGFHTLKGSGRMVGATDIAELSWDVESQLNQVREGHAIASTPLFALLHDVRDALTPLIDSLEGKPSAAVDVAALRARAQALAAGEPAEPAPVLAVAGEDAGAEARALEEPDEASVAVAEPASLDSDLPALPLPAMDPVLRQIFSSETRTHLASVHEAAQAGDYVSPALLRAVHTLQGSGRAVGLLAMADACFDLEKLLIAMEMAQTPLSAEICMVLDRLGQAVSGTVEALGRDEPLSSAIQEAFRGLSGDLRRRLAAIVPASPEDPYPSARDPALAATQEAQAPSPASLPANAPPSAVAPTLMSPTAESEIDPELVEIFREEAGDILETIEQSLIEWRAAPDSTGMLRNLKRALHTLKGGARMIGAMAMGDLGHVTETLLKQVEDGVIPVNDALLDAFDETYDLLRTAIEALASGTSPDREMAALAFRLANPGAPAPAVAAPPGTSGVAEPRPDVAASASVPDGAEPVSHPAPATPTAPAPAVPVEAAAAEKEDADDEPMLGLERRDYIKVRAQLLNELVNYAGEVSISRSRMEQQIFGFREHLSELSSNVVRFREQLRDLEMQAESQILFRTEQKDGSTGLDFDPLEFDRYSRLQQLSRALAESLHDLSTIHGTLDNFAGEAETVLLQQARVNTELQEGLMKTRLVGFATQAPRLRHIVRQTARELGKRAELHISGTEVEVDKTVLDRMIGPFEHMIRNAVDHGIESEAERRRAGKSIMGRITIHTSHEGNEIVIRFSDDGAGLNVEAIRRKALDAGLVSADRPLSDEEAMQFILLPGFSTASRVTQVSGRGIGMDVVHAEVKQLGGTISVETRPGAGTTFVVRLPLSLSITQALTVMAGEERFAVPLASVINIVEVQAGRLAELDGENPVLHYGGRVYPLMHLAARLGLAPAPGQPKKYPVLLARAGNREIAVQIEGLGSTSEIVVKPLGPQLSEIKGLAGATILGDGRVVLILDVAGLWFRDEAMSVLRLYPALEAVVPEKRRPTVMVVDDSLTVRKVTSKHLQKRGMDVMVAKDGVDALEQLREQRPDVMLVDIEMPRMDGYELTRTVRGNSELADIPIIMITSRAGDKHREHAARLGVDAYMSKPYLEEDLVANIERLIANGRSIADAG